MEHSGSLSGQSFAVRSSTSVDHAMETKPETKTTGPPDGGARAWSIMFASFLCNGLIFGVINCYSVIYADLVDKLEAKGEAGAASKASLVGSAAIGTTFFFSPIAGIFVDKFGIRTTTFIGGALASGGMLLSYFSNSIEMLCITYGLIFGIGASLTYTPSLVILGHYFKKYLGIVNGFVTAGSSIFTVVLPYILFEVLRAVGIDGVMLFLAAIMAMLMGCALLFKPLKQEESKPVTSSRIPASGPRKYLEKLINVNIWKNKKYVIWAVAVPSALFGYFVPYVHMIKYVEVNFPQKDGKLLVMCIGATSGVGRLIFGKIADIPKVNRLLLQQIAFFSIGSLTMLVPAANHFGILIAISLLMGLFDGCFISLLGPIAFELCGHEGASQAIGFLLGLCSVPLTVGPPIAGMIYEQTKSYKLPFLLAGIPPIVGATALCLVRCISDDTVSSRQPSVCLVEAPLSDPSIPPLQMSEDNEKKTPLINGDLHKSNNYYKEATGMWVNVLSSSVTIPYHTPECRHLLTQQQHSSSLSNYFDSKRRCYSYSVL